VILRQADVENLIRTKGSIYAAADTLTQSLGISFADVRNVYLAGRSAIGWTFPAVSPLACCRTCLGSEFISSATAPSREPSW